MGSLSGPAPPRGCCQKMRLASPPPSSQRCPAKIEEKTYLPSNFLLKLSHFTEQYVFKLTLFAFFTLIISCNGKEIFTNQFYVKLDPAHGHSDPKVLAHAIAKRNGFHSLGPILGSPHEFHFVHHGLPHARHKRSVPHTRKLKTDPQVHHVFQQSGFKRVKRGYRGGEEMGVLREGPKMVEKKSSWSQLRASLDNEDQIDPAVVHPEDHYQKLEALAESKEKRGYNSLKVENMVSLPPPTDPSDPLFPY